MNGVLGTARTIIAVGMVAVLGGCTSEDTSTVDTGTDRTEGVALALRQLDGQPESAAKTYLGGAQPAFPDGAGFVFYLDVTPGRVPVLVRQPGFASGYLAPQAQSGALSGASIDLLPLTVFPVADPQSDAQVSDGAVTVEIPPDAVETRDGPVVGAWEIGVGVAGGALRWSVPGDLQALRADVEVQSIVLDYVAVSRGWQVEEEVLLADDATLAVTAALPPDSPLLVPGTEAALFLYSPSNAYWTQLGHAVVDPKALTATFDAPSLGWWGLGRVRSGQACVRGRVADRLGAALLGAQVALAEDGMVGVDRRSALDDGFCMPIGAGVRADMRVLGFDTGRTALYTWSGELVGEEPGSCGEPASCLDLGLILPEVHLDADQDGAFAGAGGDCDDEDASINPNLALGDGSYCGGPLW